MAELVMFENDLDAIMQVVDDVSNVKKLDDDILSHAYTLSMELMDIFSDEMFRRGLIGELG